MTNLTWHRKRDVFPEFPVSPVSPSLPLPPTLEQDNELSSALNGEEFLDQLNIFQLLEMGSAQSSFTQGKRNSRIRKDVEGSRYDCLQDINQLFVWRTCGYPRKYWHDSRPMDPDSNMGPPEPETCGNNNYTRTLCDTVVLKLSGSETVFRSAYHLLITRFVCQTQVYFWWLGMASEEVQQ
jgi:hypothetical protein